MTGPAVRVVVVDDHPLFRQGIGALIRDSPETELTGEGASGEEAVALCAELEPDVVVMDVHMPGLGGVEATRQILRARPQTAIVMLTMMDEDNSVFAAARSYHTGGVNVSLGDGGVRFVSDNISLTVWQAYGTRSGSEAVGSLDQ